MEKKIDCYKADKGKHFVLTEHGKTFESYKHLEVGQPIDPYDDKYASIHYVESGVVIEVDDPKWCTLPGYKVGYYHKGHFLSLGNPVIFLTEELAEKYKNGYKKIHPYFKEKIYIISAVYEGKRPEPCRMYNNKTVYNKDWLCCDALEIGDYIEESCVDDMINALPPTYMTYNCTQIGEPSGTRTDNKGNERNTYLTFKCIDKNNHIWKYCGRCFRGENIENDSEIPYI